MEKSQDCCIPHVHLPISSFCHLCIISIPIFFYFFTFCPLSNMNRIKVIQYHPILHGAIMRIFPIELKYKSQHMCDWDLLTDMIHKKYSRSITWYIKINRILVSGIENAIIYKEYRRTVRIFWSYWSCQHISKWANWAIHAWALASALDQ